MWIVSMFDYKMRGAGGTWDCVWGEIEGWSYPGVCRLHSFIVVEVCV
jgi:hypothetical protein